MLFTTSRKSEAECVCLLTEIPKDGMLDIKYHHTIFDVALNY